MSKEIDFSKEAKSQPLPSSILSSKSSTVNFNQVRMQAELLELEFDIDTLLGQLQNLSRLSQTGSKK
ncbi:hypothetical protein Syn7502_00105 [Synechococcus sp. PCC 7502]|uniref:hypothetical protein n=1 Tax=Synechococcus sp. PCC 7502 TaxID=1173263 RepID=UPI00029FFE22|nr:hypothetical protein [Synechococcus sp. PCC 7502]AFY72278.1 hypothetical protein Syn7502_00105 [Synechococcus sp. PCC 7502]